MKILTLYLFVIAVFLTGCSSVTMTSSDDVKSNYKVHQLLNEVNGDVTINSLVQAEINSAGPDPIKPTGTSYIRTYAEKAVQVSPSLSQKKFSNIVLSSKTGTEFSTSFTSLAWSLEGYLYRGKYYVYSKYLTDLINKEAQKVGFGDQYVGRIRHNMLGSATVFTYFIRTMQGGGSTYLDTLPDIIFQARALYELADQSPKIGFISYNLQKANFSEVDKILIDHISDIKGTIVAHNEQKKYIANDILYSTNQERLSKYIPNFFDVYTTYIPSHLISKRQQDAMGYSNKVIQIMQNNGFINVLEYREAFDADRQKMNILNAALFYSGIVNQELLSYTDSPDSCFLAGLNVLLNTSSGRSANEKLTFAVIDLNLDYLKRNHCEEYHTMMDQRNAYQQKLDGPTFLQQYFEYLKN